MEAAGSLVILGFFLGACALLVAAAVHFFVGWRALSMASRFEGSDACPRCGYDIGGIAIPRCPECACPADERDRARWRAEELHGTAASRDRLSASVMLLVLAIVCATIAVLMGEAQQV